VKRFKTLCDKYTEYNLHLQSIYSELDYAYIEGYGGSWANQLSVENKLFAMPEESLILHRGILEYDTTGELRAEAMQMFPADLEFKAMENLFPTHTWGGERVYNIRDRRKKKQLMKEIEQNLPKLYKWPLNYFNHYQLDDIK
jgi:hypothetical protein